MKYKMLVDINIQYDDGELTEEEWEDIKKAYEQEYVENGVHLKMNIIDIKKEMD